MWQMLSERGAFLLVLAVAGAFVLVGLFTKRPEIIFGAVLFALVFRWVFRDDIPPI